VDVDAVGDVAVLEVPPHRHPHRPAGLVVPRRPGWPPPAAAAAVDRGAEAAAAVDADAVGVGGEAAEEDLRHGGADPPPAVAILLEGFGETLPWLFHFCHDARGGYEMNDLAVAGLGTGRLEERNRLQA